MEVNVEIDRFQRYMNKMVSNLNLDVQECVRMAADLFARSAARHSPPFPGRRLSRFSVTKDEKGNVLQKRDMFNRSIRASVYVQNGSAKIYFPKEKAKKYLNKSGLQLSRSAKNMLMIEYSVMRKKAGARGFTRTIFEDLSEAKRAAKILTRGLLRAGWWGTSQRLGKSVEEQYGDKVSALVSAVSGTQEKKGNNSYTISVINAANIPGAETAAASSIAFGMGKAANQMRAMLRKAVAARTKA